MDAVSCALDTQTRLVAAPKLDSMRLRIGVHLGDVLFQDELLSARPWSSRPVWRASPIRAGSRLGGRHGGRGAANLRGLLRTRRVQFAILRGGSAYQRVGDVPGTLNETLATSELLDRTVLSVRPARAQAEIQPPPVPPCRPLPS